MRFRPILACLAAAPLLIGAAEPLTLAPTGPWVLDYAEKSCRLARAFGTATNPTTLLFESNSPDMMSMVVMGNDLKVGDAQKVTARFLPSDWLEVGEGGTSADRAKPAALWPFINVAPAEMKIAAAAKAKSMRWSKKRPPPLDLAKVAADRLKIQAFAATITHVEIKERGKRPTRLRTGALAKALIMLEQCNRDQLRKWGVDPAVEDKIVRRPWPIRREHWFESGDYPDGAVARGEQSVVAYRLLVDASGKPTQCTTLTHFKAPAFPVATCNALMRRARFEPAELADGSKVASYFTSSINWTMPASYIPITG